MFTTDIKARKAIEELEESLGKLKREFSALQLDWYDTLDKLKKMMQRVAKRAEVAEKLEAETEEQPGVDADGRPVLGPELRRRIIEDARKRLLRRS